MPVTRLRRPRSEAPAQSSWEDDLSGDRSAEAQPLAQRRPKRRAADTERSEAEGSDEQPRAQPYEWPEQHGGRRAPQRTAAPPETPGQASRRALEELQRVLRRRGHEASELPQLLQGWTGTRERSPRTSTGMLNGYHYKFTDPDGETHGSIVKAACAAEQRFAGVEEPLFDEVDWGGERYRRLAALPRYRRPFGLRRCELPPPPVDPVPPASGGFAYGDDWSNGTHAPWLVASLKAAGGDIGDERCERPRNLLAAACEKADVRPPAYQRFSSPGAWIGDVEDLAKSETDSNRRAALLELVSVATQIDSDCREAARENVEWDEPRCCHVAAALAIFSLEHGTEREAEVQDCVARYGEDDEIELEWLGPNRPFDLDHLAWTEIPRVPVSDPMRNFC